VWGSWLGTILIGAAALTVLVGLSVLASPLFAVILCAIFGGLAVVLLILLRGNREPGAGGGAGPADRSAFRGGPGPTPRDGGAPASGEGAE
jgi:hypothetical protein